MEQTLYRHAAWDTPWRVNPSRWAGRYNLDGDLVQYWCTHPLGPAAEMIRWEGADAAPQDLQLRLWAARVDFDGLIVVDFDNATDHGITPGELVGEDYGPTQILAHRLRDRPAPGLVAPSAALPGTQIVVLFGPRVLFPYLWEPIDFDQVPTAHISDSPPPGEALPEARHRDTAHSGLVGWERDGVVRRFIDPPIR